MNDGTSTSNTSSSNSRPDDDNSRTEFKSSSATGFGVLALALENAGVVENRTAEPSKDRKAAKKARKKLSAEELAEAERNARAIRLAKINSDERIVRKSEEVICTDGLTRKVSLVVLTAKGVVPEESFADFRTGMLETAKADEVSILIFLEAVPEQTEKGDTVVVETFHHGCIYLLDESVSGRFMARGVRMNEIGARKSHGFRAFVPKDITELDGERVPADASTWVADVEGRKILTDDQPSMMSVKALREHMLKKLAEDPGAVYAKLKGKGSKPNTRRPETKSNYVAKEVIRIEPEY